MLRDNPTSNPPRGRTMKRLRRVVLTIMGTGTIGAVSTGFVERRDCGPGFLRE
jgi:hypothetical protein